MLYNKYLFPYIWSIFVVSLISHAELENVFILNKRTLKCLQYDKPRLNSSPRKC